MRLSICGPCFLLFFFTDTATTEIYTLSLHDALPICGGSPTAMLLARKGHRVLLVDKATFPSDTMSTHLAHPPARSEEHTSELQSQSNLVCRLLLEKKKKHANYNYKSHSSSYHRLIRN